MPALILLSYGSLLVLSLMDNIRSPYFPEILADLHLNGTTGSAFFAMTNLVAFAGSWSSHRILQSKSSLYLLSLSSVFVAIGFGWISFSHDFWWLMAACAVFGWAYGSLNLAHNMMIFEASPIHLRRRFFSGLHSMYGLTALFAPLAASGFRWMGISWREALLILSFLPLLVITASLRFKGKRPVKAARTSPLTSKEWKLCLLISLMNSGYLWGEISATTRAVLWLRVDRGFTPDMADLYLAGFFLTFLLGRGFFSLVPIAAVGNQLILCTSAGLSALFYFLTLKISPLWLIATGLAMAPFFPVAMAQVSHLFHEKSGQALGFILGFGSLNVVVMHLVVGVLTDRYGISRALLVGPAFLFIIFVALIGSQLIRREQRAELILQ